MSMNFSASMNFDMSTDGRVIRGIAGSVFMRIFGISSVVVLLVLASFGVIRAHRAQAFDSAASTTPRAATSPQPLPVEAKIRALSYNIFMRPPPVSWGDRNKCRARSIARRLNGESAARDIVVLNESFEQKSVAKLAELTSQRYPYQILRQPAAEGLRVNGGVSILSRHPIEEWSATPFEQCHGEWNDCLATKGFVWARIRISDQLKVNVLATHLNSGGSEQARQVRRSQLRRIREFMRNSPSVARWPTLLMGDLNINGLRWSARDPKSGELSEYAATMNFLGNSCQQCADAACLAECARFPVDAFRRIHGPWQFDAEATRAANTYNCVDERMLPCVSPNSPEHWGRRLRLDYILHFGAPRLAPELQVRVLGADTVSFADDACSTTYLSDHKAVAATIAIGEKPRVNAQLDQSSLSGADIDQGTLDQSNLVRREVDRGGANPPE
jgi:endonuclease/exonuclease/phosphatase family metal-dependent hydrolase